ncbi:hypothetical protein [Leifsonia aquatica]|uniref:hypothetical protein n=1 Tax=Leifsonia aquatica TaxID=144185 RepID=UPI0038029F16
MASVLVFAPYPSGATVTVTPDLITEFETTRESRNVLHKIIGTASVAVTFKPGGAREGTLHLLFSDAGAAKACEDLALSAGTFTLTDADMPDTGMSFVPSGRIDRSLEDETRALWLVAMEYTEVTP